MNIFLIEKFYENELIENQRRFSIYEFREVFNRYVGLTLEINNSNEEITESVKDFYRISKNSNKKLAENCLHRRNRQRLFFHQNLARRDFWEIIGKIFIGSQNRNVFLTKTSQLIELLEDFDSKPNLQKLFAENLQTLETDHVSKTENELWKTEIPKPLTTDPISVNIKALTATMNLSNKD